MITAEQLLAWLTEQTDSKKFLVAFSGGVDSTVLLHLLRQCRNLDKKIQLRAVHINHQLQLDADAWQQHCADICAAWKIDCIDAVVDVDANDDGIEAAARTARYQAIAELALPDEVLLTAQHADDQAETVLARLLRSSGVLGLSAMQQQSRHWGLTQLRPLLQQTKKDLCEYAQQHQLQWIEDHSNHDNQFERNFIRNEVLPLLKQRWPHAVDALNRSAKQCGDAQAILDDVAFLDSERCFCSRNDTLIVDALLQLSAARQRNVLRYWLRMHHASMPSAIKLQHILSDVLLAREDAQPCVSWAGLAVRRFQGHVYLTAAQDDWDNTQCFAWSRDTELPAEVQSCLAMLSPQHAVKQATRDYQIRFRQGGETIKLPKRGTHDLKKLLQEWGVPPWLRARVPLLYVEQELVAVLGYTDMEGADE